MARRKSRYVEFPGPRRFFDLRDPADQQEFLGLLGGGQALISVMVESDAMVMPWGVETRGDRIALHPIQYRGLAAALAAKGMQIQPWQSHHAN